MECGAAAAGCGLRAAADIISVVILVLDQSE